MKTIILALLPIVVFVAVLIVLQWLFAARGGRWWDAGPEAWRVVGALFFVGFVLNMLYLFMSGAILLMAGAAVCYLGALAWLLYSAASRFSRPM